MKNKISLSVTSLVLVIFCLLYFIVIPTVVDIKTIGKEIETQRIDLEDKYIKGQSLRKLSDNLKSIEPKLDLLNQIFINKNRELEFITTLENEANANQISQKIILNSPAVVENQNFQKTRLQLFTKGDFVRQLKYLADMEALSYYINVKILELSPAGGMPTNADDNQANPQPTNGKNINMFIDADTYWN